MLITLQIPSIIKEDDEERKASRYEGLIAAGPPL